VNLHGHAALYEGQSYRGVPVEGEILRGVVTLDLAPFIEGLAVRSKRRQGKVSLDMAENLKAFLFYCALYVCPVLPPVVGFAFVPSVYPVHAGDQEIEGRYLRRKHQTVGPSLVSSLRRTSMPDFLAFSLNRLNRSI